MVPPWPSTIFRERARPRPVPSSLEVKKGLQMRSRRSGSMPGPLSRTRSHSSVARKAMPNRNA